MGKVLMIGAGGVATVAAFKIVQNQDVFTEFMIASRRKEKCDELVKAIHDKGYKADIKTAQVDDDDVEQLKELFNSFKSELVINLALPYQDLTIMISVFMCKRLILFTYKLAHLLICRFVYLSVHILISMTTNQLLNHDSCRIIRCHFIT